MGIGPILMMINIYINSNQNYQTINKNYFNTEGNIIFDCEYISSKAT